MQNQEGLRIVGDVGVMISQALCELSVDIESLKRTNRLLRDSLNLKNVSVEQLKSEFRNA
jgi:hypothetical protein